VNIFGKKLDDLLSSWLVDYRFLSLLSSRHTRSNGFLSRKRSADGSGLLATYEGHIYEGSVNGGTQDLVNRRYWMARGMELIGSDLNEKGSGRV
jgi:hypothetical protein